MKLPDRIPLANLPTRLERSVRLGDRLGIDLWWKRDDLTGAELSGNKVRKLEFLLADALAHGADTVLTCGGGQSNHCRATALAAARLGLRCVLLLRVPDPASPPPLDANSLMGALAGAEIRYVSVEEYRRRAEIMAGIEADLRAAGRRPYAFPEGGSNAVGALGYVAAMAELRQQIEAAGIAGPLTVVYAAGSGGTGAGIELGIRALGWTAARALGVAVCDDRTYFQEAIARIAGKARDLFGLAGSPFGPSEVAIVDDYIGPGYARSTPRMLAVIPDVAAAEGVVLDPVYTGKAFFGLSREAAKPGAGSIGRRVVFLHTGGVYGLFPFAPDLRALVPTPPRDR